MKHSKKLSVITICYNEPDLDSTCKSIVNQTWQDFEWIVIDGGSDEKTLQIFEKYKNRINIFVSEKDNGIYDGYNKGIRLANSDYVIFMNAGDSFYDNKVLEKVFKNRILFFDILYGNSMYIFKDTKKNYIKQNPRFLNKKFFVRNNLNTQSVFIKTNLLKKYGGYNLKYKIASDLELYLRFISNGATFRYVPHVIANYDKHGISSDSGNVQLRKNEVAEIRNQYLEKELSDYYFEISNKSLNLKPAEKIFSIKNTKNRKYKLLTIFGLKIKLRENKI